MQINGLFNCCYIVHARALSLIWSIWKINESFLILLRLRSKSRDSLTKKNWLYGTVWNWESNGWFPWSLLTAKHQHGQQGLREDREPPRANRGTVNPRSFPPTRVSLPLFLGCANCWSKLMFQKTWARAGSSGEEKTPQVNCIEILQGLIMVVFLIGLERGILSKDFFFLWLACGIPVGHLM